MIAITLEWIQEQFPGLSNLALIAEGGQKWVLRATHCTDGAVVLKLIKQSGDAGARIQREILAVKQVASARVPKMREVGSLATDAGPLVWVREDLVAGASVRQCLQRGPLAVSEAVRLGLHVLEALADAERARIVHRDVKPDNVMRANDGAFWLLDFGIARHLDLESLTATSLGGVGTLGYAPPEQYKNRKREIDIRADLFALGVTVVECLLGKNPFRDGARDAADVIRRIEESPLSVPSIKGDTEGAFADFLRALTQRRADCRPSSASDALAWLKDSTTWVGE